MVLYRPSNDYAWLPINRDRHTPFRSYHHRVAAAANRTTHGLYAIQSVGILGIKGRRSKALAYFGIDTE